MEVLSDIKRKARKQHRCNLCNEIIQVGEIYNIQTCVDDGQIYDFKSHVKCWSLCEELDLFKKCDGEIFQENFFDEVNHEYQMWAHPDATIVPFEKRLELVMQKYEIS